MAEYIDREALGLGKAKREIFDHPKYADGWNAAVEVIQQAPSEDVEKVVHCVDCEHLMLSDFYGECSRGYMGIVSPWDYCSRGRQRTRKRAQTSGHR